MLGIGLNRFILFATGWGSLPPLVSRTEHARMKWHNIHRFHSKQAADMVCAQTKTILKGVSIEVRCERFEGDDKEGQAGIWSLGTYCDVGPCYSSVHRMVDIAVSTGTQLALARELERCCPSNPLLTVYHLRPGKAVPINISSLQSSSD